ncbi:hypothetical protein VE03_02015 [Pseudogymnoascus sp. 23342-1-I1]|nr:hypothetical protein VE03_02015 [Pseudogymnoascus sp. 23342-1-I1]
MRVKSGLVSPTPSSIGDHFEIQCRDPWRGETDPIVGKLWPGHRRIFMAVKVTITRLPDDWGGRLVTTTSIPESDCPPFWREEIDIHTCGAGCTYAVRCQCAECRRRIFMAVNVTTTRLPEDWGGRRITATSIPGSDCPPFWREEVVHTSCPGGTYAVASVRRAATPTPDVEGLWSAAAPAPRGSGEMLSFGGRR